MVQVLEKISGGHILYRIPSCGEVGALILAPTTDGLRSMRSLILRNRKSRTPCFNQTQFSAQGLLNHGFAQNMLRDLRMALLGFRALGSHSGLFPLCIQSINTFRNLIFDISTIFLNPGRVSHCLRLSYD